MSKERELLKGWLCIAPFWIDPAYMKMYEDTKKLLAQPEQTEQEPVATKLESHQFTAFHVSADDFKKLQKLPTGTKIYTAPPKREQGLREDLREGISFCDHFAGLAMQELMAADVRVIWDNESIAELAYDQADAMMIEKKRRELTDMEKRNDN